MTEKRSYVVTGAAGGIGTAIVARLVARGGVVVGVDLADADFGALETLGAVTCRGSITDRSVLERAADLAGDGLAGWVNNAATFDHGSAADVDIDQLRASLETNLIAGIVGSQIAIRRFLATGTRGSIVNVSSIQGIDAFPGWLGYGIAKAGLNALARSIAVDYGANGIRANAVAPGTINTPAAQNELDDDLTRIANLHALRRLGQPEEVAALVAFLLSDDASNITGATIPVDGGRSIYDSDLPR